MFGNKNGKSIDTFVGKKRVKEFSINEEGDRVSVLFDDNSTLDCSIRQWESMKSETAYEDGMVRVRLWNPLVAGILREMLKDDMPIDGFEFIIQRVKASLDLNYDKAIVKLFDPSGIIKTQADIGLKLIDSVLMKEEAVEEETEETEEEQE